MLDNTLEFLMMNGIPLPQAVMMCIPEPWANDRRMNREKRDFYHYYATMPIDYDRMLRAIAQWEEKGMSRQQAEIEAFYAHAQA